MRLPLALITASILLLGSSGHSLAQSIRLGPGGVEITPEEPQRRFEEPERRYVPPPPRDELQSRMFRLHEACEDGDRHACVRFGIIIGENRERRAAWRHDHPELFFYER